MRGEHVAQPLQGALRVRGIQARQGFARAREAAHPIERGWNVRTIEDGLPDVGEPDLAEAGRPEDRLNRCPIGERERIRRSRLGRSPA